MVWSLQHQTLKSQTQLNMTMTMTMIINQKKSNLEKFQKKYPVKPTKNQPLASVSQLSYPKIQ